MKNNKDNGFQLLSLKEVFKDRFFNIPDYQRGYSWEEEQWNDLKSDVENLFEKDYKHFTGTIVAARKKGKIDEFNIVDGQQRLTTLLILLHVIYHFDKVKYSEILESYFVRGDIGNEKYALIPNEETRVFFTDMIYNNKKSVAKIKSHKNLKAAKEFFKNWILQKDIDVDLIYKTIINKIGFILFTPHDNKEIGIMFEVINNRGKQVTELEKIKNYFIYYSTIKDKPTLRQLINDKWKEIQENLSRCEKTSNDDEDNFLRYTYLVFYDPGKENSSNVYNQLKKKYNPNEIDSKIVDQHIQEMIEFVQFLANASTFYTYLYVQKSFINNNSKNKVYKRIDNALNNLRYHPFTASIMPLYLAIMNSFNQPQPPSIIIIENRVADLLELLEKVNFRLYLLPGVFKRSNTKQSHLFSLANEFFEYPEWIADPLNPEFATFNEEKQHTGNIYDWLEIELFELIKKFCPVSKFVEALTIDATEDYDYYNWRDSGLRYLLAKYEEKLKLENRLNFELKRLAIRRKEVKETQNDYLSIEHIWARENKNPPFKPWHKEKRRLGNLVLMGFSANVQQSRDDIPDKVNKLLFENKVGRGALDMHQIAELKEQLKKAEDIIYTRGWARKTINYYKELSIALNDLRETKLIKFALQTWKINGDSISDFIEVNSFKANEEKSNQNYFLKI